MPGQAGVLVGCAIEALGGLEREVLGRVIATFLRRLARSERRVSQAAGSGTERRLVGDVIGSELSAYGETIALSAFPA